MNTNTNSKEEKELQIIRLREKLYVLQRIEIFFVTIGLIGGAGLFIWMETVGTITLIASILIYSPLLVYVILIIIDVSIRWKKWKCPYCDKVFDKLGVRYTWPTLDINNCPYCNERLPFAPPLYKRSKRTKKKKR